MNTYYLRDLLHSDKRWCIECRTEKQLEKLKRQWQAIVDYYKLEKKNQEDLYTYELDFSIKKWMTERHFKNLLKKKKYEKWTDKDWYPLIYITGVNYNLDDPNTNWMRYRRIPYSKLNMSVKPRRKETK